MKKFRPVVLGAAVVTALLVCSPNAHSQLRPLDPVDPAAFSGDAGIRAEVGAAYYTDQRASLAGTQGPLWEIANFRVTIRTGRMLMEMGGTVQRLFRDDEIWAAPYGDARPPTTDRNRHDAGDYRVAAVLRLTPERSATLATLRFGTRLPTTDNFVGLDRDATDFFATLGAHHALQKLMLSAEAGLSINGTRKTTYEQSDVLVYGVTAKLNFASTSAYVMALGQEDMHRTAVRGNEDLGELRLGVRSGRTRWLDAAFVRGYREFSPKNGIQLGVGSTFR